VITLGKNVDNAVDSEEWFIEHIGEQR